MNPKHAQYKKLIEEARAQAVEWLHQFIKSWKARDRSNNPDSARGHARVITEMRMQAADPRIDPKPYRLDPKARASMQRQAEVIRRTIQLVESNNILNARPAWPLLYWLSYVPPCLQEFDRAVQRDRSRMGHT